MQCDGDAVRAAGGWMACGEYVNDTISPPPPKRMVFFVLVVEVCIDAGRSRRDRI